MDQEACVCIKSRAELLAIASFWVGGVVITFIFISYSLYSIVWSLVEVFVLEYSSRNSGPVS